MKNSELLDLQTSADLPDSEQSNSTTDLTAYVTIDDTPFAAIKEDEKWVLVFGNHKVSNPFNTVREAERYAKKKSWELILTTCYAYIDLVNQIKSQEQTTEL